MSNKLKIVNYNVYGNLHKNIDQRKKMITDEIFKNGIPDIICLQEVTQPIVDEILKINKDYYFWSKKDDYIKKYNPPKDDSYLKILQEEGYLIVFSKWNIISLNIIYFGNFFGEGIIHAELDTEKFFGFNLNIVNFHASGGTFGETDETIKYKIQKRIYESKKLNLLVEKLNNVVITGDFNADVNNILKYPEISYHPDYVYDNIYDIWKIINKNNPGYTEDEILNTYRSALKIKPINEIRRARYDKILYRSNKLIPKNINLIGTRAVGNNIDIEGKDKNNKKYITKTKLFPSDHFGLYCEFIIK